MKWTTLLSILSLVLAGSAGYGQVTLKEKNAPLEKVLAKIEKQTNYVFLYDPNEVKMGPVTIIVKKATLQQTLDSCFKGTSIEYSIVANNVLLRNKQTQNSKTELIADVSFRGKVMDETGQPLQGVTIFNKREKRGTETDTSGAYTLPGLKGDLFTFSFVGYSQKEIRVGNERQLTISLEVNASNPDQVVVIGYGSSKKRDLTGAVSSVNVKGIDEISFNTVDNALAGKAAGVEITKTDGTPGGMLRVRIRGSSSLLAGNDPLYVIDGVPVQVRNNFIAPDFLLASPMTQLAGAAYLSSSTAALPASFVNSLNSLGGLNPDDIESITILKDASSAAIYGSKAANGVVIITTKTGKPNQLPRMDFSYATTVSSPYRTPKLLNATQYKTLLTEAAQHAATEDSIAGISLDLLSARVLDTPGYFGTANTNWIRQVTRTTVSNDLGLSIAGGGQASKYYSSMAYSSTPGVVDGTGYRRISGKFNGETQIGAKLRFATNLLVGSSDQDVGDGAYAQAMLARPDRSPRTATGGYTALTDPGDYSDYGFINPKALLTATNNARTLTLLGSFSGSYAISKDLKFRSTVSLNMQNYNQRNYIPGDIPVLVPYVYTVPYGVSSSSNSRFTDWFLENTLSYNRRLSEKHALNIVIGQSYESTKYSYFTATAGGYPNNNFSNLSSADTILSVQGDDPSSPQSYLLSFYARTNYSYLDKYLFTFTGRADGSSKFGAERTVDYFPSGALAWRISREGFLKKVRWLSDLKLRGSYGLTGNQNIGDQTKHTLYSSVPYAGGGGAALIPTVLGNNELRPEITKETDIGLDVSLFADRLYATVDYYNRQTGNAILTLPVTPSSTYATVTENAAGIRNRGFEASIGGDIIRTRDFKWAATLNVTWNRSLVTKLSTSADVFQFEGPGGFEMIGGDLSVAQFGPWGNTALMQGKPLGLITGYLSTGLLKTQAQADAYTQQFGSGGYIPYKPGDRIYQNFFAYGYWSDQANVILANGAPKYFGGSTQELTYKNIDLQCFFSFSMGGHLLWAAHGASNEFYGTANANVSMLNRYTPSNTNTNQPILDLNFSSGSPSNLDVFSSSYVKLRSLVLGYRFDQAAWMKRTALRSLRFFLSATNVFTITKYPGSDPETSDDAYSVSGGYIDAGNYPAVRTFTLGLKAGF